MSESGYIQQTSRKVIILTLLAIAIPIFFSIAVSVGVVHIDPIEILTIIFAPNANLNPIAWAIIWNIRIPRALMALIAGATLATSGITLQGVLRNPLVSPFTIGVSLGASFGAALAIVLGVSLIGFGPYIIMANAFLFALIACLIALFIAKIKGMTSESVILSGIAMTYIFSALITLLQYVAQEWQLKMLVHWMMGDLALANWSRLYLITPSILICIPLFKYAWDLNSLMMGEEVARSLGTNPERTRFVCSILSALAVAIVVCITGPIGFIGLVAPHIARLIVGADYRFSMTCSFLLGAIILLSADTIARVIIAPIELPVGVVTAFLGVPLFVYLLLKARREIWR
ncbi:MAG: iron ABC transporter permease [Candidatus Methanomethylicota archaeon]|uniref:Iron ABC transporter permease n=1 Tax=Thermoproteota archaeon TaxID=2056631 RepID=A0A497F203_9CREN|nr:MAG: iron ABC transporter permease [Candidatus Verstraetearchaeota archaeon]